ncbi:unnamed protein product [Pleuronectes platessa]|uniref:Uncharacterized protein n=1 Tax=Pleuronectes platessa TaxID=8262 RepID=A0A9N7VZ60_PLEPL|nr:unnamed protein product [Pleuronectes platessa]
MEVESAVSHFGPKSPIGAQLGGDEKKVKRRIQSSVSDRSGVLRSELKTAASAWFHRPSRRCLAPTAYQSSLSIPAAAPLTTTGRANGIPEPPDAAGAAEGGFLKGNSTVDLHALHAARCARAKHYAVSRCLYISGAGYLQSPCSERGEPGAPILGGRGGTSTSKARGGRRAGPRKKRQKKMTLRMRPLLSGAGSRRPCVLLPLHSVFLQTTPLPSYDPLQEGTPRPGGLRGT